MLNSMTGFGQGEVKSGNRTYTVEIKSVNHRYCEIFVKIPRNLSLLEEQIKSYIKGKLDRGKIDVNIRQESLEPSQDGIFEVKINKDILEQYLGIMGKMCKELNIKDDIAISNIIGFPEVLSVEKKAEDAEEIFSYLKTALNEALDRLVEFRIIEGEKLKKDIEIKIKDMSDLLQKIKEQAPFVPLNYMKLLNERITEYFKIEVVDEQRIAQEVAVYAEKCCIDEEIVRLEGHIEHFGDMISKEGRIGRKLDFMTQEMNREINTIGSKANDLSITRNVVELKGLIEQIKEQVQNIE